MTAALIIIGALLLIYLVANSGKKDNSVNKKKVSPAITKEELSEALNPIISEMDSTNTVEKTSLPPMIQNEDAHWVINPNTSFELTVLTSDESIALKVRECLENEDLPFHKRRNTLIETIAGNNLKFKEIEDYKKKYGRIYFETIDILKSESADWDISGQKDKEDLLSEFRVKAIEKIYERANCDLEILFEYEPSDITIDDELISVYGFDNMQTYIENADKPDKVRMIPNDHYYRKRFESLHKLGLASRGKEIPSDEILLTLTLKTLNQIAQNPDKKYHRKAQAVEFIMSLPDFDAKIGNHVSLRELFKLNPLPSQYSSIKLDEIAKTWSYHGEEVRLLMDTFQAAKYDYERNQYDDYATGYRVVNYDDSESACPCAVQRMAEKYSKGNRPRTPFHLGCNCHVHEDY